MRARAFFLLAVLACGGVAASRARAQPERERHQEEGKKQQAQRARRARRQKELRARRARREQQRRAQMVQQRKKEQERRRAATKPGARPGSVALRPGAPRGAWRPLVRGGAFARERPAGAPPAPARLAKKEWMPAKPAVLPATPQSPPRGVAVAGPPVLHPPLQHAAFLATPAAAAVVRVQAAETRPNTYYWHSYSGGNYVHYYTGGYHWYGFYNGSNYYWTRYYANRWWWYDPGAARWDYYNGGYWWWQNPAAPSVAYVYAGGAYVPYAQAQAEYSAAVSTVALAAPVVSTSAAAPAYASDVDIPTYQMPVSTDSYALVVGVESYQNLPKADFAARDAETMRDHLLHLGFPERNIILLTDSRAARSSLVKYVEAWLPKRVDARSRVFVYFAGHGAPDPQSGTSYLMPWDGDPKYLADTGYPLKRLYEKLSALPAADVVVALDSCFSGAGGRSVLPSGARPLVTRVDEARGSAARLIVYSASAADEITGTDPSQGHGLFTYYFLKGINGAAESDGQVTVQGLFDYVQPSVEDAARRDNRDQSPQLLVPPDGERTLPIRKDAAPAAG